jgi:hypothetical protein
MPEYNEIPDHIVVAIMIDKFHTYEFTKTEKFFAFIGSPEF